MSISDNLKANLKSLADTDNKYQTTGYFILSTFKRESDNITGHCCVYNADEYSNLISFLEVFLLEMKQQLLTKINTDEELSRLMESDINKPDYLN